MGLVGPWLSTTTTKKRKEKITKAQMAEFEQGWRARNKWLKQMQMPKQTFDEYMEWVHGRGKKESAKEKNRSKGTETLTSKAKSFSTIPAVADRNHTIGNTVPKNSPMVLRDWPPPQCTVKPSPTYTGTKMIGIGTMHKSNSVPVFSDDEAKEISSMRR